MIFFVRHKGLVATKKSPSDDLPGLNINNDTNAACIYQSP